ncbi:MAG: hypothetical protein SA339_04170 [Methanomassiliicoccus sp.]|nr:hypothetical protein [Methanomassiliicoccus sp.]
MINELMNLVTSGSVQGLPTIVIMAIPFIVGLVVGLLAHKVLKIALIALIVLVIATYLGLYSMDLSTLHQLAVTYGTMAYHYGILVIGILPLTTGFVIGAIIGFILS